jgi:hypothetical protein
MILHNFFIFEYFLAYLAPVLFNCDLFVFPPCYSLFLFLSIPFSNLFPVLPESLLVFLSLLLLLLFLLPQLLRLLSILLHLVLLVARVSLLDIVQQFEDCLVELLTLLLTLFFILRIDKTLDTTIRGRVRVVLICIREFL